MHSDPIYTEDPHQALAVLAELLENGGTYEEKEGRIKVTRIVLGGTEVTEFKGDSDMYLLRSFLFFRLHGQGTIFVPASEDVEEIDPRFQLIPPEVAPLLRDEKHRLQVAALLACGVHGPEEIQAHAHHRVGDLIGAAAFRGQYPSFTVAFQSLAA